MFCATPNIYHPHKSKGLRDSAAQTADRDLQSAGPPILLTIVDTHFRCRPRGQRTLGWVVGQSSFSASRRSTFGRNLAGGSIEISDVGAGVKSRAPLNYSVFTRQVQLGRSTKSGGITSQPLSGNAKET